MKTIANILSVLRVLSALGLLGCVSDFSPDPQKRSPDQSVGASTSLSPHDAGATPKGSAPTDAVATSPRGESSNTTPVVKQDAGGNPTGNANPSATTSPPDGTNLASGGCDLTGRWIMTERGLSSAFGAKQINILWHYLELTQQGDSVTMKKALLCGGDTEGEPGGFAVMMDDSQAWPSYQMKTNYNGRKDTSTAMPWSGETQRPGAWDFRRTTLVGPITRASAG